MAAVTPGTNQRVRTIATTATAIISSLLPAIYGCVLLIQEKSIKAQEKYRKVQTD